MDENLKVESERLTQSWMQHESEWLRDYLVQDVEDPRINLQSIFSRHFVLRGLWNERFLPLMEHEYRFSACMNWLRKLVRTELSEARELELLLHALRHGADNAESFALPPWIVHTFLSLPGEACGVQIPNYVESFLEGTTFVEGKFVVPESALLTFQSIWKEALIACLKDNTNPAQTKQPQPKVFEPACGSANDFRWLEAYGIADFIDYTGMDLCPKNIQNARSLFPEIRFEVGDAAERAFDYSIVHDLFEHLSVEGLRAAVRELCRVTRLGICAGFFSMDEMPEHIVRPLENYHWNTLSVPLVRQLFAREGFNSQVVHVGTFLRRQVGCNETHNPNAYTFFMWKEGEK